MTDDVLSRTSALRWATIGLTVAAFYVCWPLWPALVLAAWTAALARPLLVRFERGLKGRRRAAAVFSLLLFLVVTLPLAWVVLGVIAGAQELAQVIADSSSARSAFEAITAGSGGAASTGVPMDFQGILELVQSYGTQGLNVLKNLAGAATKGVVGLFIFFFSAFVFLVDGAEIWRWLQRHSPLRAEHLQRLAAAFHETGRGLLVGVGLTTATQGVVATLVYLSLGIPRWWVLGAITGLASMIPVVGSALIWGPIAVGLFVTGHPVKGAILVALGAAVISTADNILRPVYARMGSLNMPILLLFVSIFGGLATFGTWGAILGPLIVRLWMEALAINRDGRGAAVSPAE